MIQRGSTQAKFIKPPNKLKMKVGTGGIDERLIVKAQENIQKSTEDFEPFALQYLKEIKNLMEELKKGEDEGKKFALANAIMQIKANGGMFGYQLVSEIAGVALFFIETIETLNKDALNVIDVHYKTLHVVLANKLKGDGGKEGYALAKELEGAAKRYFKKYPLPT